MNPDNQNPTVPTQSTPNTPVVNVATQQPTSPTTTQPQPIQQPITQPTKPPITEDTPKPKNNILPLMILLLVLVGLGFGGYSMYQNYLTSQKTQPTQEAVTPIPIATENPTADWKTYTNTKYYFSFKYPPNFGNQGAISGPFTGTSVAIGSFSNPSTIREETDARFDGFNVFVVTDLKVINFDSYINNEIKAMNSVEFASMKNPTRSQLTNGVSLTSEDASQAYYYIPTPDQKQIVVFAYLQANSSFKQIFDQILSTFKFTNNTTTSTPKPTIKTSFTPRPVKTATPTPRPTTTSTPIPTTSCNYDLNSATGAIQFTFNPSKGTTLYWSTVGEVKAQNGCKVLDGSSTDVIQRFRSSGSNTLSIPSIPAGTYEVRYSYHDSWGGSQTVSVSSGQQTNVTFSVDNSSDP